MKSMMTAKLIGASILFTSAFAQAQQLASVASNFDVNVWARPAEFPVNKNYPKPYGEMPVPCSFSHLKYDDPIRKPGQAGTAPLHVFFGNTSTNASSTYQSLRSNGEGTCFGGPLNRSAMYIPALMNNSGQVVLPDFIDVFYTGDAKTVAFPRGLKMIFGFDEANPGVWDVNNHVYSWSMHEPGGYFNSKDSNGLQYRFPYLQVDLFPIFMWKNGGYRVLNRLVSPDCWDGVNLDSANHRSHLAYRVNNVCPSTHPVSIPKVTVTVAYSHINHQGSGTEWMDNREDARTWKFSSDRFGGKTFLNGQNTYVGFIPAWDDNIMSSIVTKVLNPLNYGSLGKLGDGRILEKPTTSKLYAPTSYKPYFLWSLRTTSFMGAPQGTANNNLIPIP